MFQLYQIVLDLSFDSQFIYETSTINFKFSMILMTQVPTINTSYDLLEVFPDIGFTHIPDKVREDSLITGFSFNLLVVGRRGLGTSTLINSLFSAELVDKERPDSITTTNNEIYENNIKLSISVTTYHSIDISKITRFIESVNNDYFEKEQGLNIKFEDKRIHAALYLIPSDKISSSEMNGIKELSKLVNLIPVISKADMFTADELKLHRTRINEAFLENEIEFFNYNETETSKFPMATVASEIGYMEDGKYILGRNYPWGFVDIENEEISDFKKLQSILISEYFQDLKYKTDVKFFNDYRSKRLQFDGKLCEKAQFTKLIDQMSKLLDEKLIDENCDSENEIEEIEFGSGNMHCPESQILANL